ncbi:hypothetical protein NCPPB3923_18495 [Burkholderia glumae]|nr:hypothetical protein NCPPB3923_18495 [Burkholderia glumae]
MPRARTDVGAAPARGAGRRVQRRPAGIAPIGALPARLERGDVVIVIGAKLAFGKPLARTHDERAVTLADRGA